eukprot:m51a1_g9198 hypothetical protein (220) ;mRNA; f:103669-104328
MAQAVVNIDVTSDLACPWCYVGKARLTAALEEARGRWPGAVFRVRMFPYIIDRATRPAGETYRDYNVRRWGGDGWTRDLRRSGRGDGLAFADWRWWPNTVNAHRLVLHAARTLGEGADARVVAALFDECYERGANISGVEELDRIARACGVEGARGVLESDAYVRELDELDGEAKRRGIDGVPHFEIYGGALSRERAVRLGGAQPSSQFIRAFETVLGR